MAILRKFRRRRRKGPVAFVLSGGGNLGALQIGMLKALMERDIQPDLILGCSVGAINGAGLAENPSPAGVARLQDLWSTLNGKRLMPNGFLPRPVRLARRGESIHGNAGLREVLESQLGARTFEGLKVPFQCVATDVLGVREVWFREGPLIDPILASAALPAVYPAVEIDGVRYLDGAIVDDVPVGRAVELGARTIYVLQVGAFSRPLPEPRRPLDVAIQSYWLARHHRFKRDLRAVPKDIDVVLLPTGEMPDMRYNDFGKSAVLIESAYRASRDYLAGGVTGPEMPAGTAKATTEAGDDGTADEPDEALAAEADDDHPGEGDDAGEQSA